MRPTPKDAIGYHYLLIDKEYNIKLGFSKHPGKRLKMPLQGTQDGTTRYAVIDPLSKYDVLGVRPGTLFQERAFHKQYYRYRVVGEWYPRLSTPYLEAIRLEWDTPETHIPDYAEIMRCVDNWLQCKRESKEKYGRRHFSLDSVQSSWYT